MARLSHQRLVEDALTLIVDHESASPETAPGARAAFQQWRGTSARHAQAAEEAQRLWNELTGMTDGLRAHFKEAGSHTRATPPDRQRRSLLLSATALLGTGVIAGGGLRWYWRQPLFAAAYLTRTAQTLAVMPPDGTDGQAGSQLDMAPRSAVDVALYRERREVRLSGGEVRFDIAHDPRRPFIVMTREARIEVVGTVFTVRDRGGPISVGVERGHVRVSVLRKDGQTRVPHGQPIDLRAGQALDISQGLASPPRRTDAAAMSAWRDGWLVFENVRLDDALDTINAYRRQPILSRDPRVSALRLSGRFRADDSTELMAVLPTILPLSSRTHTDGTVELTPR